MAIGYQNHHRRHLFKHNLMLTTTLLLIASIVTLTVPENVPDGNASTLQSSGIWNPSPTFAGPANCSSDSFHKEGKCGGFAHGYLRCPEGYWCSEKGFCGTTLVHRINPSCPRESRKDPVDLEFRSVPSDDIEEPIPNNEPEDLSRYQQYPAEYCTSELYHRWGKCGLRQHGYFRCPFGEWCSASGYCGKTKKYRDNAICPRENRSDPQNIKYTPTPDDDPFYYGPFADSTPNDETDQIELPPEDDDFIEVDSDEEDSHLSSDDEDVEPSLEVAFQDEEITNTQSEVPKPEDTSAPDRGPTINISSDAAPETSSDHDTESSSRFNFEHGEIPLGHNGAGQVFKFRVANLYWILALLINFINL